MIQNWDKIEKINGWFLERAAWLFHDVNELQKSMGIIGDIMEIGVYHGKSAAFLGQYLKEGEKFYAVDTFNGYNESKDFRWLFEKNFEDVSGRKVDGVYPDKSTGLWQQKLERSYRFWHIDGYHSFEDTMNDLELGSAYTHESGVIVVDDFLNAEWLGVNQGVNEFLRAQQDDPNRWRIVAYGHNKLILVRNSNHEAYYDGLKASTSLQVSPHNFLPYFDSMYLNLR